MKKIYILAMTVALTTACQKEKALDTEKSVIEEPSAQTRNNIEQYIYDSIQKPYNVGVLYKFVDNDFSAENQKKYLYPATESNVIPILKKLKRIWIDPYTRIAGEDFIKGAAPRQISLIGSWLVNEENGTITLGFADSGMKIALFGVDKIDLTDRDRVREYFHTVHHEYCHIINQKKPYSDEFAKITPSGYTAVWSNHTDAEALQLGFISAYARANNIEDFAEMTAHMLIMGKTAWDTKINAITSATAKESLRKKEAFVVNYFKSEWNIDFYELQAEVQRKIQQ